VTNQSLVSVLYVNLDRRTDRRERLESSIPSSEFAHHRIEAVDAKSPDFKPATNLVAGAEAACWMSHQKAYRYQVNSAIEYCLILEDDADFENRNFSSVQVREICAYMSRNNIKIFQLGYLSFQYRWWEPGRILESARGFLGGKHKTIKMPSGSKLRIVQDSFRSGTHAYLVTIDAARQLSALNNPAVFPADDFLSAVANYSKPDLLFARSRSSLLNQQSRKSLGRQELDSDIETRE
jgi:GR25 family glycosyltransferase involved in LPS biosynthesis